MVQINIKIFPPDDAQTERPRQINFDGANRLQFVQIAGKVWVPGLQPLPDLGPLHDFVWLGAGLEKRKNDSVPTLHLIKLIEIGNIKKQHAKANTFSNLIPDQCSCIYFAMLSFFAFLSDKNFSSKNSTPRRQALQGVSKNLTKNAGLF